MSFWFVKKKQEEIDAASEAAVQDVLEAEKGVIQQAPAADSFAATGIPRVGGLGMPIVGRDAAATSGFASPDAKSTNLFKNEKIEETPPPAPPAVAATPQEAAAAREAFLRAREEAAMNIVDLRRD